MLPKELVPSPLFERRDREPTPIRPSIRPARLRVLHMVDRIARWAGGLLLDGIRGRLSPEEKARRIRVLLEDLGGFWIKAGQILSLRRDVLPAILCDHLSQLQDRMQGYPPELAKEAIEDALGVPVDRIFDVFEDEPLAAASIGQVHRARLAKEEVWVAVKVRRPHAAEFFRRDMRAIKRVVGLFRRFRFLPHFRWSDMIWELEQVLREETDYRVEAAAMRKMKKSLRRHNIYVPKVFEEYSTDRVLVMEYLDVVFMSDYIRAAHAEPDRLGRWLAENNIDPEKVGWRLYSSLSRQIHEDNLFHGDLHPGNIALLRDSRIALIDFGTVGSLEADYHRKFLFFTRALTERRFAKAADLLLLLSSSLPAADIEDVKSRIVRALRAWETRTSVKGLSYREKSLSQVMAELGQFLFTHKMSMEWSFLRIDRAQLTLDASLLHLCPDTDYLDAMGRYFRKAARRTARQGRDPRRWLEALTGTVDSISRLPLLFSEVSIFQDAIMRKQARVFQVTTSKFAYFFEVLFGRVAIVFLLALVVGAFAYLHQHHADSGLVSWSQGTLSWTKDLFPFLAHHHWFVFFVLVALAWEVASKLKRRFQKFDSKDV
ncbi:MAG: AarF/ABC1/UbiB kinase family protein [Planctomycetes bacterium]|nr:AarF/ABC1/UbiB kinase family protein [Planctomycetota bacterium]